MRKELPIQGGQVLAVVVEADQVILRIQKDGHNRGIAKLDAEQRAALIELLQAEGAAPVEVEDRQPEGMPQFDERRVPREAAAEEPASVPDKAAPRCPKHKAVFKAVNPVSGNAVYRSSARDYSHAAVVHKAGDDDQAWSVWSFHGSAALAAKAWPGYEVRVIPVEVVADRRQGRQA